jgi:hypothetical protein
VNTNNNALSDPGSRKFDADFEATDKGHCVASLTDYIDILGRTAYRRYIEDAMLPSSANPPETYLQVRECPW